MDEYIIKETLQAKLNRKKAGPANKRYTEGWNDAILMVKSMIHGEKAADVAPIRHGRWIAIKVPNEWDKGQCSQCRSIFNSSVWGTNYCPNCGAKMDLP